MMIREGWGSRDCRLRDSLLTLSFSLWFLLSFGCLLFVRSWQAVGSLLSGFCSILPSHIFRGCFAPWAVLHVSFPTKFLVATVSLRLFPQLCLPHSVVGAPDSLLSY
jgi:hypothetical protein